MSNMDSSCDYYFVNLDRDEAKKYAAATKTLIERRAKESPLRHHLSSSLPVMFPERPWWIIAHAAGAESDASFRIQDSSRHGFIDSLIGKTAIEYEKNLKIRSIFAEGFNQVKEYCAALLNEGVEESDILGVLSDTLEWYAYSIKIAETRNLGEYGPDDLELIQVDRVSLETTDDSSLDQFEAFINKYYGRLGARSLSADSLSMEFGRGSDGYNEAFPNVCHSIEQAFSANPQYGSLIESLWQGFVSVRGGAESDGLFDRNEYAYEAYLVLLAKVVCANILAHKALCSDDIELGSIIDGDYFANLGIANLVEYDYFGWLTIDSARSALIEAARPIQRRLMAYDFVSMPREDLFGSLVSQLADSDKRILLGQEPTPHWLASSMVQAIREKQGREIAPRYLDMCCGSGVFVVEVVKTVLDEMESPKILSEEQQSKILNCVAGFDIDPLAVLFAKVNWVMALSDYVLNFKESVHIPIYHADSLFVSAPVIANTQEGESGESYLVRLDDQRISLPAFMLDSQNKTLFDSMLARCYAEASFRSQSPHAESLHPSEIEKIADSIVRSSNSCLTKDDVKEVEAVTGSLISSLEILQRAGRNGIWPFLLNNGFKPALMAGRFNGIVSNPPWLAMSRLSNNPYCESLTKRAEQYGIRPGGRSFLHLELASVFLLSAVDRYLEDDGVVACVMPDSIVNGKQHEPFRKEEYKQSSRSVQFNVLGLWRLPRSTFKNKAAVVTGVKKSNLDIEEIDGIIISEDGTISHQGVHLAKQGKRTAWISSESENSILDSQEHVAFAQGADLMPRTYVFFDAERQANGKWSLRSIPRVNSPLSYLVSDAKKAKEFSIDLIANISDRFIFNCFLSKHVMPFYISEPAYAFLPIVKTADGYRQVNNGEMVEAGASFVSLLDKELSFEDGSFERTVALSNYFAKLDIYKKLSSQHKQVPGWYVVYGAGGKNVAAAILNIDTPELRDVLFDQTLYWFRASSRLEALFYCALLNSEAINEAIKEYQPEGAMGQRHIHMLPLSIMPLYDQDNLYHQKVVANADALLAELENIISSGTPFAELVDPASGSLNSRRRRYRELMQNLESYSDYSTACNELLGL